MFRRAVIVSAAFVWLCSVAALYAQEPPRTASIEGVVVELGTGAPVVGARVTLSSAAPGGPRGIPQAARPSNPFTMTDEKGRFTFRNVNPGAYGLQLQADGFLPIGAPIALAAGQDKTDVAVSLTRAGNVGGHLRDLNNQALSNVLVQLVRPSYDANGVRRLEVVASSQTDDRGEFRISWVTPGRYYLKAGNSGNSALRIRTGDRSGGSNPNNFQPTTAVAYYPGTPDIGGARAIDIGPGADLSGVDWQVAPLPAGRSVRARVIDARTGRPPQEAVGYIAPMTPGFELDQDQTFGLTTGIVYPINPSTGFIDFPKSPPGVYLIMAVATEEAPLPLAQGNRPPEDFTDYAFLRELGFLSDVFMDTRGVRMVTGSAIVTISDADVNDAQIQIAPAGSISGRLRIEGDLPAGTRGRQGQSVRLIDLRGDLIQSKLSLQPVVSRVIADGSFRLDNVGAGEYRIAVVGIPSSGYIKSAQLDGVDVLGKPLVLTGPGSGTLDVVVGVANGRVEGRLVDARSEPVSAGQIVLVPSGQRGRVDLYKIANPDAAGRFAITGVAPGAYKAFAWQSIEQFSWFDAEVLERWEDRGVAVHVAESSVENIEVRIIPIGGAQ